MDPQITLKTSVQYLKGVGPERYKVLCRLGLYSLGDLFYFFPRRYEDRSQILSVSEITGEEKECVGGIISSRGLIRTKTGQSIFRVVITDKDLSFFASWFNQPYLSKVFLPKSRVVLYGKAEKEGRHFQMIHPEYEIVPENVSETVHSGRIVPIYPLTEDLSQKGLRQFIFRAVRDHAHLLRDPLTADIKSKMVAVNSEFAFSNIHFPKGPRELESAYKRLVFDEFLLMQLLVRMKKNELQKKNKNISHASGEEEVGKFIDSLDFQLTEGQAVAVKEIVADMKKDKPMHRLVQGDVGSGKTVVAAAGLCFTVANGFQGALMAPTEVLAQQHYLNLTQLLEPFGISCGYLAQGLTAEERKLVLSRVASGEIQVLVGTHALIQEDVKFKNLGLAVVDEQHKFGVIQRAALKAKAAEPPHFLLMTATPIPRTLSMTLYGDLDISVIAELPKGRKPIRTLWVGESRRPEIYQFLDSMLEKGRQGYVICPLVEEGSEFSAKSVTAAYKELAGVFAHRKVGILHGKMKGPEKKKIMQDFKEGKTQLLVSTVVIEVGIDVPNSIAILIENAEKFGLAQLHQLRGRVGRGSEESFCILFSDTTNPESVERLSSFEETSSGFQIAEKDLELRGAGDVVGEKQHGLPQLRIGDLSKDITILEKAGKAAAMILEKDPRLELAQNKLLRRAIQERYRISQQKLTITA